MRVVHVREPSGQLPELAKLEATIVAVDAGGRPGAALACEYRAEPDVIGLNRQSGPAGVIDSSRARARRLFATRALYEFTLAVWTNEIHLSGASCAIGALVTADESHSTRCECGSAFFTLVFQFQPHFSFSIL